MIVYVIWENHKCHYKNIMPLRHIQLFFFLAHHIGLAACIDPDVRPKRPSPDGAADVTDEPRLLTLFTTLKDVNHKMQIHRYLEIFHNKLKHVM